MKLVVFGASKGVGRLIVEQALAQDHTVVAFARNPSLEPHPNLMVVQGDVLETQAVASVVQGADAVLCALGSGNTSVGNVRSQGTANIAQAMTSQGVRRLIALSSFAVGDSRRGPVAAMAWMFLRAALEEHERQEAVIRASKLDFTIIRPPRLTDDPATLAVRVGSLGRGQIPRADVAAFMLRCLANPSSIGQAITIST